MKIRMIKIVLVSYCIIIFSNGCSANLVSRSPQEWLTLAHSGLTGIDEYSYSAHVETGVKDGLKMNSFNYNGDVHSHQEYTISGVDVDATILHPAKYLDLMNNNQNTIKQTTQSLDVDATRHTVTLEIDEQVEQSTSRWKTLLMQQFEQVKLSSEHLKENLKSTQQTELSQLFTRSELELQQLLETLEVQSKFFVTIDSQHAIPLKIDEQAILHYVKEGQPREEYRLSNIQLQY